MKRLPEPQNRLFSSLITDIEDGEIKIPQFQRNFVWTIQKSAGLIDSIIKGYPIGTFILWKTKDRLRSVRNIGDEKLPETKEGEYVNYVLDGQQRLTSIYACIKGIGVTRDRENRKCDDFSQVFINLEADEHEQIVTAGMLGDELKSIKVVTLLTGDFDVLAGYPEELHKKIKLYQDRIKNFQYPIVQVKDTPIDIATEIFTRINVGGKPLSSFEIMVAKTFDDKRNFDLSEKYQQLIDKLEHYQTISEATVLQVVSILLRGECKRQVILQLEKDKFIKIWDDAVDAIERTVDYFKSYFRIPVSSLLPYNALIVPFAYFFFKHNDKPTGDKQTYLQDFFWRCSLSGRYSSALESKLAQDIKKIDEILLDELPQYDWPIDTSTDFIIKNGYFNAGRSYIKAILCIYAYYQPKSFIDDSLVNVDNSGLKRANSRNYHHFFPKSYLKGKVEDDKINHILNITIVDDYLNKRKIGSKNPSKYMNDFKKTNSSLSDTMKTHLISDLKNFGVWDDNYDDFFDERAKRISEELSKRIVDHSIDRQKPQTDLIDDYEEEGTVSE